jgi:CHAD domain-containing protein
MARAKPIRGLKCDAPVDHGARLVLMSRMREMISLRDKAFDWSDVEGVHAMRVASRRLRSALRDFREVFPKNKLTLLAKEGKTIADSLGSVRDEDVALIALEKLRATVPPHVTAGINLLIAERVARRDRARAALVVALTPNRLSGLAQLFGYTLTNLATEDGEPIETDASVELPVVETNTGASPKAEPSFRHLGISRIGKQFRRLQKDAICLYNPLAGEPLHELRIEAKRLRYALELFGVCWRRKLDPFAQDIAELQGALGDLHDSDEWIGELERKLTRLHKKTHTGKSRRARKNRNAESIHAENDSSQSIANAADDTALEVASLWLLDHFVKERTKHYRRALDLWSSWQESNFALRLDAVLNAAGQSRTPVSAAPRPRTRSTKKAQKQSDVSSQVAIDATSLTTDISEESPAT